MTDSPNYTLLSSDQDLLVVNKPAGLRVIPDGYQPDLPCLSRQLVNDFGPVWVVHRLDRDTSGLVVFARSADAHRKLNIEFAERRVRKEYLALILGQPDWAQKLINLPLKVNGDRQHRTLVDYQTGKPAQTEIGVQARYRLGVSLVTAAPHSGYTHQIRVHLAAWGFPILNDPLYRALRSPIDLRPVSAATPSIQIKSIHRLALHAQSIRFTHPSTSQTVSFTAPLAEDFSAALTELAEFEKMD